MLHPYQLRVIGLDLVAVNSHDCDHCGMVKGMACFGTPSTHIVRRRAAKRQLTTV